MGNMSYCRFRNTLTDLQDCSTHTCDDDLSKDEHEARIDLIKLCRSIAEDFENVDDLEEELKYGNFKEENENEN